ncbi:hypothetical protein MPTK1_3g01700 [Marchantia polymorpha subsp. ruderalis]|uniref:RING-type E3 ubiquitin transferase n=2 Tax=Marchantia polymorpha TaxID=3197 RepID=A0AAF6AWE4_MARPO|nr:hypothetical protein MARPO_0007s0162 [Marchantia polymorpha]BBN04078.1 hypothetical protein Mp_3g01700 [Marchantia polymorpha subsp. ruderalis]|eukprot:PTQ47765.1 hypothetical protein MARPO_0007s0162 [Marchantia polymorpha]
MSEARGMACVPSYYQCPISLQLMRDPVTVSSGHTYDRCSIERWFHSGNKTCPASMQVLETTDLIPNLTLRRLIQDWCRANRQDDHAKGLIPQPSAHPKDVRRLIHAIGIGSGKERLEALRRLRSMAKASDRNRRCLVEAGALSTLGAILSSHRSRITARKCALNLAGELSSLRLWDEDSDEACEEALGTLGLLSQCDEARHALPIVGPSQMCALSWFLCRDGLDAKMSAAMVLGNLLIDDETMMELGSFEGVMRGLVDLLKEDLYPKALSTSLRGLQAICWPERNRLKAVRVGVVEALVELLPGARRSDSEKALGLLELLSAYEEGRSALCRHALSIPVLLKSILRVSETATERALETLLLVFRFSSDPRLHYASIQHGAFMQLLLVIQSESSLDIKDKARELLKLLQVQCNKSDPCIRTIRFS